MKALILAAGYATRLYPLTKEYPKPLLQVKGRPIIDHVIEKLSRISPIDEIFVVTNSKFIGVFRQWKKKISCPKKITLIDDLTSCKEDRLGAIGDMHFVVQRRRLRGDLLVVGGDNIFNTSLEPFVSFAKAKTPYPVIGVYDVGRKETAKQYGVVKLDARKRVVDFLEKPKRPPSAHVAMCLYYFPKGRIGLVKEYMDSRVGSHDAIGHYIDWLRKVVTVYGFVFAGSWYDIGHHTALAQAQQKFPSK